MIIEKKSKKTQPLIICAEKEKINQLGEDSYSFSFRNIDSGYIAVYDGCGGMGARKYSKVGNKTGARIASRLAAYLTDKFYNNQQFKFDGFDSQRIKSVFKESFNKIIDAIEDEGRIKLGGDLFKSIPTTASIISIKSDDSDRIKCEYIWAGDSRGYYLDAEGLCQITKDDLKTEEDAFTNLRSDGRMSNVICAQGDFYLNERDIEITSPVMLITSTDGAFDYFLTPMDFEFVILKSLSESNSKEEWKEKLSELIASVAGDDFAVCIAVFGFDNYRNCKKYFLSRYTEIKKMYIDKYDQSTSDLKLMQLWNSYKQNYYRR